MNSISLVTLLGVIIGTFSQTWGEKQHKDIHLITHIPIAHKFVYVTLYTH